MRSPKTRRRLRKLGVWLIILVVMLALVEVVLRCMGERPGRFNDSFDPDDSLFANPVTYTDSLGITRLDEPGTAFGSDFRVNADGFRSDFDYSCAAIDSLERAAPARKRIMMIGDSYVAGCCIPDLHDCFPDRIGADSNYLLLNFGVPATHPHQYALVAQAYLPKIRPALAVICVYLGNDVREIDAPLPYRAHPWFQRSRNRDWISCQPPDYLTGGENVVLRSPEEAQAFYMERATLRGPNRNFWERCCGHSVLCSKIALGIEYWRRKSQAQARRSGSATLACEYLLEIRDLGQSLDVPLLFVGLPSAVDIHDHADLNLRYGQYLGGIPWVHPPDGLLDEADYDGPGTMNHFTVSGHRKVYGWLSTVLSIRFAQEDSAQHAPK